MPLIALLIVLNFLNFTALMPSMQETPASVKTDGGSLWVDEKPGQRASKVPDTSTHRHLPADVQLYQQSNEICGGEKERKAMHVAPLSTAAALHPMSHLDVRSERSGAFQETF